MFKGDIVTNKDDKNRARPKEKDLWSRITALAEKEGISYLEATEKCVKEYWKDKGLTKEA
jgi:hypothetical protein